MHTAAQVKKMVLKKGRTRHDDPDRLYVSEHDGELWATNAFWLVPVNRVKALLDAHNLPSNQPGCYEVQGSRLVPQDTEPPKVGSLFPPVDDPVIVPATLEGCTAPLYRRQEPQGYVAVMEGTEGRAGSDADYLHWLDCDGDLSRLNQGYGSRLVGSPVYRQVSPLKVVGIYAKRERQATTGNDWLDDGELLLGLLMPVRL